MTDQTKQNKIFFDSKLVPWGLWALLIGEYLFIFLFLLNYYFAFMHHENFLTHKWILSNGKNWHWEDLGRSLNVDVLEGYPDRIARPLSNLLQVIDVKFRAFCWNFIPPHPSLSCYWPLFFLGTPFFLFKFFKNMGCYPAMAFGGMCLYVASIGFLGPLVMFFHPAKNLVNFFTVLSLFLGSRIYAKTVTLPWNSSVKEIPHFWRQFILFWLAIFVGFFCDETGLFIYITATAMLYPILILFKERRVVLGVYLLLPMAYGCVIDFLLPFVHLCVRGRHVSLAHCHLLPQLDKISWGGIKTNGIWLLADHPHMQLNIPDLLPYNPVLFSLQLIYTLSMCFVLCLFIKTLCQEHSRLRIKQLISCIGLLFLFVIFQSFLFLGLPFQSWGVKAWGVWWYGSLFSLLFFIGLTFVLQLIAEGKYHSLFRHFFVAIILLGVLQGLVFGVYRVDIIEGDRQGYETSKGNDGGYTLEQIFNGRIGPYYKSLNWLDVVKISECRRLVTVNVWSKVKHKNISPPIAPKELAYCDQVLSSDRSFVAEAEYLSVEL